MGIDLIHLSQSVAGRRVAVVGDTILDVYLRGATRGLCREAPAPVVAVQAEVLMPGGAANTAVNVVALGGSPRFVSAVGDDTSGRTVRRELVRRGVDAEAIVVEPGRATHVKRRVVVGNHILVRLDEGSTAPLGEPAQRALNQHLATGATDADAIVVSDNGYGTISPATTRALLALRGGVAIAVVDAKDPLRYACLAPTVATPDYAEAVRILGVPGLDGEADRVQQIKVLGHALLDATAAGMVVVTLGAAGAVMFERDRPAFHARVRHHADQEVVGAGDVFASALALALTADADPAAAVEYATLVASAAAATAGGTAVASRAAVAGRLRDGTKVLTAAEMAQWADAARDRGQRIVFTNGCFDLMHEGHVMCLNEAKALGDVLIVGVNDDASVRALKGPGRPVVELSGRLRLLAALSCVDAVVAFSGPHAVALIESVRPHVFAKGGDYRGATMAESGVLERLGVEIHFLSYLDDRSTSRIIDRVRAGW